MVAQVLTDRGSAVDRRKALGAYYTPVDAAHYLASWALRREDDVVLEPSAGDGAFLAAAADVAASRRWRRPTFVCREISAVAAADLCERGVVRDGELVVGDFLDARPPPVDAVIGNPPFVRLRSLPPAQRDTALSVADQVLGEPMMSSGSVWMPFVLHALDALTPGGRLALVLPWDFTYVRYARILWRQLGRTFGSIRAVRVRDRLFPEISQDVLLLLADDKGRSTTEVTFETHESMDCLARESPAVRARLSIDPLVRGDRVFQEALLPAGLHDLLRDLRALTVPTRELVRFHIGYVSGDKDFFHPGAMRSELPRGSLRPALTSARRLRGSGLYTSRLDPDRFDQLRRPAQPLTGHDLAYAERGRQLGVDQRYKCRVREPWYEVPGVEIPDLVLSVFAQRPLLMVNDAEFVASNSLLCGFMVRGDPAGFAAAWYSSLTLLQTELEVHSLGGGVLVMVLRRRETCGSVRPEIATARGLPGVERVLAGGDLDAAYQVGDDALATRIGQDGVDLIRSGVAVLEAWRTGERPAGSKGDAACCDRVVGDGVLGVEPDEGGGDGGKALTPPVRPSPSVVVADRETGAPHTKLSTPSASPRRSASRGRFPTNWTDTLPTRTPLADSRETVSARKAGPCAPDHSGSAVPNCVPRSPSLAAPRRASQSRGPRRHRLSDRRSPAALRPQETGQPHRSPATSGWTSTPVPTRKPSRSATGESCQFSRQGCSHRAGVAWPAEGGRKAGETVRMRRRIVGQ